MRLPGRQRGMGMWGWMTILAALGFLGLIVLNLIPHYLNEMALSKAVRTVANDPNSSTMDPVALRNALERFWDIEDIKNIKPKDVKVVKTRTGRSLSYDYEARAPLVSNLYIVAHFQGEHSIGGGGPVSD